MSPLLHTRKRVSFSTQSPAGDFQVSSAKRKLISWKKKVTLLDLPDQVLHKIFGHSNLLQLGILSQVCNQLNKFSKTFLQTTTSIPVLFPSMSVATVHQNVGKFFISGSIEEFSLDMRTAGANFRHLGIMVKKLTCLLSTRERLGMSTQLMSRLSPCTSMSASSQMMSLCGVFLHQVVQGWTDEEVILAAQLVFHTFNSGGEDGCVSTILAPGYQLGSRPDKEMHVRSFLYSVFYREAVLGQEGLWLETLLVQSSSRMDVATMSRVLLLLSSPAKEEDWQFGVQWADHVEAIPATLAVASARYHTLVALWKTLKQGQLGLMIPSILSFIFQTPSPWLPENVGSVLLLLGHQTSFLYLQHSVSQVTSRTDVCTNCFKNISTAIIGQALMTARFRWSFSPMFSRLEEVIMQVPAVQRENLLTAIWKALAEEVTDIRQAEGEDWAMEGNMHFFKVIRLIGQKMTEKAFMQLPPPSKKKEK